MKGTITISRWNDDKIHIAIRDEASGIEFVDACMHCESFARAVTGVGAQEAKLEIRGLEYVGKKRVTEQRRITCPIDSYDRKILQAWLRENAQEEGWLLNDYLGSQSSICRKDGATVLRYSVTKYVEEPNRTTQ